MQYKQISFCKECGFEFYKINWKSKKEQEFCKLCSYKKFRDEVKSKKKTILQKANPELSLLRTKALEIRETRKKDLWK